MPKASQHGEYLTLRSCFVPNLVHAWDSPLPLYGWLGGSRGPLYAGQALSKQRKREIRDVFEKSRQKIHDLASNVVLNRMLDGSYNKTYLSLFFTFK